MRVEASAAHAGGDPDVETPQRLYCLLDHFGHVNFRRGCLDAERSRLVVRVALAVLDELHAGLPLQLVLEKVTHILIHNDLHVRTVFVLHFDLPHLRRRDAVDDDVARRGEGRGVGIAAVREYFEDEGESVGHGVLVGVQVVPILAVFVRLQLLRKLLVSFSRGRLVHHAFEMAYGSDRVPPVVTRQRSLDRRRELDHLPWVQVEQFDRQGVHHAVVGAQLGRRKQLCSRTPDGEVVGRHHFHLLGGVGHLEVHLGADQPHVQTVDGDIADPVVDVLVVVLRRVRYHHHLL